MVGSGISDCSLFVKEVEAASVEICREIRAIMYLIRSSRACLSGAMVPKV